MLLFHIDRGDSLRTSLVSLMNLCLIVFLITGCQEAETNEATGDYNSEIASENNADSDESSETESKEENLDIKEENEIETESNTNQGVEQNEGNTEENPRDGPSADKLNEMKVHYIDVGQADATLIEYSYEGDDFRILIDTGNWDANNVVNYLESHEISHLDILIGTHPHADHIGQIDQVIANLDVEEVWLSGDTATSDIYQEVMDAIEDSNVEFHEPRAGEGYDIGPLGLEILNPDTLTGDLNEGSVSLRMDYGEVSFIFTGDAESQTENAMSQSGLHLEADILQLGHHGSNTATTDDFLNAVNPDVAIYSAGSDNQYGHPHDEVISRVTDKGIELYGTDVHGTVIVSTDGATYDVTTKKDGNITPASPSSGNYSGSSSSSNSSDDADSNDRNNGNDNDSATNTENCVDINSASTEEIESIIHFGPARAEELVHSRPFKSVDSLSKINGIGEARLADIKSEGLACVGGE